MSRSINNKYSQAFTIVEVIVVIVIIGILTTISVVSYGNWRQTTMINTIKNDLSNAAAVFENYRNFNNSYPLSISNLSSFTASSGISVTGGSTDKKPIVSMP